MDKKISEIFDYGDEIDVTEEINRIFDPEEIKEATMNKIHNSQGERVRGRKNGRRVLVVAIAAVLVLSMTVGAAAAGVIDLRPIADVFAPVFGNTKQHTELTEQIGQSLGASATDNGITVSVDGIMGDPSGAVVVFSLHGKGVEENDFSFGEVHGSGVLAGMTGSFEQLADNVTGDDTIRLAYNVGYGGIGSDDKLKLGQGSITLVNLVGNPLHNPDWNVDGQWTLDVNVEYEDSTVELPVEKTFRLSGRDVTIHSIYASPLSISYRFHVDLSGDRLDENGNLDYSWEAQDSYVHTYGAPNIEITAKDGTCFVGGRDYIYGEKSHTNLEDGGEMTKEGAYYLRSENSNLMLANDGEGYRNIKLNRLLLPEDIESITIEGVEVYHAE